MVSRSQDSLAGPITLAVAGLLSCYIAGYALQQGVTSTVVLAALAAIGIWSLLIALSASIQVLARVERRTRPHSR
ncbi:MAG: hypothetical protein H0W72_15045 [Planctomycetes bacterium]|nr:hypothetical protein [Planctomycetota bacterium]